VSNEQYEGVKFQTVFLSAQLPANKTLYKLKKWCKLFHDNELAPVQEGGSAGNLSFRTEKGKNEFIITGTQIGLKENLTNNKFVLVKQCDFVNKKIFVEGITEPSSESFLHAAIYNSRPEINAIMHGHSEEILKNAKRLNIKETKKETSYGTLDLVDSVLEILEDIMFIIIKNHGFISLGKTIDEAGKGVLGVLSKI